jgi:hypothetical protein
MEAKPKSKATPAQLKQLEANRIKGMETRKMKAQLRKAELEENKKKLVDEYESKILKKSSSPTPPPPSHTSTPAKAKIEETEDPIYDEVQSAPQEEQDENYPIEIVQPRRARAPPQPKQIKEEPDYRQEYYKHKLTTLTKKQQEEQHNNQFTQQYSQLPAQSHAIDIAKSTLVNKANKEMLSRVYNELFGS